MHYTTVMILFFYAVFLNYSFCENLSGLNCHTANKFKNIFEAGHTKTVNKISDYLISESSIEKNKTIIDNDKNINSNLTAVRDGLINVINSSKCENDDSIILSNPFQDDAVSDLWNNTEVDDILLKEQHDSSTDLPPDFSEAFRKLLDVQPPFDPRVGEGISEECRRQSGIYVEGLKAFKLWALKIYDSSAKIPSGLLRGNVNQYGDFDQCLEVGIPTSDNAAADDDEATPAKYCLASIQLEPIGLGAARAFDLVHSHYAFRSRLTDPGHRVPRFSSLTWALCVPRGCSSSDVQSALAVSLNSTGLRAEVLIEPEMCQSSEERYQLPLGTVIVGCFFASILALATYATFYEKKDDSQINNIVSSFSLKKNLRSLLNLERSASDVQSVHGVRCLNAVLLLLSHKCMAIAFMPFVNRTILAESLGAPWSVLGRAASLYTDPFIMFSGMLTSYSFQSRISKGQGVNIAQEYIGRLFRIVPTMCALVLFCTWLLPSLGSGPQWPLVVQQHADICKKNWWRNFLFIHNYFGFENMCLTHTHHVGIDTQLFMTGAPLALLMSRPTSRGFTTRLIAVLALLSAITRYYATFTEGLSNYVFFGISVERMFRTADYMYILPAHRFTVYAMGLLLGVQLRRPAKHTLSKVQLVSGWVVSLSLMLVSFLGPAQLQQTPYIYSAPSAAFYAAVTPVGWCLAFAWLVYTSHHGHNNFVSRLSSWRGFLVWTRLSYAIYLVQFPVFFYYVGKTRVPEQYDFMGELFDIKQYFWILFWSVVLTLLFDLPFQNIKKILFRKKIPKVQQTPLKENSNGDVQMKKENDDISTFENDKMCNRGKID